MQNFRLLGGWEVLPIDPPPPGPLCCPPALLNNTIWQLDNGWTLSVGPLFCLLDPTYYTFLESLEPGLQLRSVPSHDDHHHDDQEAQKCPWSDHLEENRCLDGIFLIHTQHIICFWNPWNQEYKLRAFTVMMNTTMMIRKLRNVIPAPIRMPRNIRKRPKGILEEKGLLSRRKASYQGVWNCFDILLIRTMCWDHLESFLTLSGPIRMLRNIRKRILEEKGLLVRFLFTYQGVSNCFEILSIRTTCWDHLESFLTLSGPIMMLRNIRKRNMEENGFLMGFLFISCSPGSKDSKNI